jgi:hypothetical protein
MFTSFIDFGWGYYPLPALGLLSAKEGERDFVDFLAFVVEGLGWAWGKSLQE